jgi:hypothetical protein
MSISLSCSPAMMTTGIFKSAYRLRNLKASGIISADSAADAFIWEGRSAISFGNASNFFGTDRAPKILRIISGQIARLIRADKVWLRMSPTSGKAGVPLPRRPARLLHGGVDRNHVKRS